MYITPVTQLYSHVEKLFKHMAVLMYALESWVMAVVGMAWLSLRSMYPTRSLMEEYLVYGQVIVQLSLTFQSFF